MTCSFSPKSRDNNLKCFQQVNDIDQISRQLVRTCPKSENFQNATAPKAHKCANTFRDEGQDHKLSLRSERVSFKLHRTEKLKF